LAVVLLAVADARGADDYKARLAAADELKTSNHAEFLRQLERLDAARDAMSPGERTYLRYLHAYQLSYGGDYLAAIDPLKAIYAEAGDVVLRFRAGVTLTNMLALSARYDEAYAHLNEVLELQRRIADPKTSVLGYGIAGILYNQAGQYDLAEKYADNWIAADPDGAGRCKGVYIKVEALYRSGRLDGNPGVLDKGLDACKRINDPVFANLIRTFAANHAIDGNDPGAAAKLMLDHYDEVQATQYTRLTSEVDSIIARAYLMQGRHADAGRYARSAVSKSVKAEITKPLIDAYEVLYRVAKQEGDLANALAFHEKFATADKGYLNDTTARTLAYQMVNQQVLDKKRQIDALNERNQLLELQGEVASKAAETDRLYVTLLVCGLAFIGLWAYRTKRSQMRFQDLARRDGLTGILNRQHFMEHAKAQLQQCVRAGREVALILIDLDNFKLINDSHGHAAGDSVLRQTVAVCQELMRTADTFGRLGGEEFGVLLPDCTTEVARTRAEALRAAIAAMQVAGLETRVSASFGVTSSHDSGPELRQMLLHADSALYRAKHEGRNRVEAFSGATEAGLFADA
jgi:diguanylate cyclase (GGDEF)-like protein